jgi:hypothetical protein
VLINQIPALTTVKADKQTIYAGGDRLEADMQAIYEKILRVAKDKRVTYYSDIAPLAGLNMSSEIDRIKMGQILDEISRSENLAGRPLLAAVVILKKRENIPGEGFFTFAKNLGLYNGGDDLQYWAQELDRVHRYWS